MLKYIFCVLSREESFTDIRFDKKKYKSQCYEETFKTTDVPGNKFNSHLNDRKKNLTSWLVSNTKHTEKTLKTACTLMDVDKYLVYFSS